MSKPALIQLAIALSLVCAMAGIMMLPIAQRTASKRARINSVLSGIALGEAAAGEDVLKAWLRPFGAVGRAVIGSGLLSPKALKDLEETMAAAGYRSTIAVSLFIGAKVALVLGIPTFLLLIFQTLHLTFVSPILIMAMGAIVGLMLPDYVVRSLRKKYLKQVEDGIPAALDLLIICAEAGLALEAGFDRVAKEFEDGVKQTSNELRITANEMKVLADRRQALVNMGKRTGLESMQRLGGMLAQSQKYGTPLTQALRVLAVEMRATLLTRYEERAARLPVLLTIPMILFILPCVFVVVAGPAAVQVIERLHHH